MKAGWTAFVLFLLLIGAVVVLAFSLVKQLRKAQAAKDAGVYGDEPSGTAEPGGAAREPLPAPDAPRYCGPLPTPEDALRQPWSPEPLATP